MSEVDRLRLMALVLLSAGRDEGWAASCGLTMPEQKEADEVKMFSARFRASGACCPCCWWWWELSAFTSTLEMQGGAECFPVRRPCCWSLLRTAITWMLSWSLLF